ncbi:unnamed protein product [Psylliodes chrysocephalus]|uniref:Uncharacterized protein n=1 Tax=Psylliodes chrysocephalus TaxID=3402493 RepID=A0A9P0GCL0_9CUCU|nr:unnamed protein product [Psylliodes chrysocephala]
MSQKTFAHANTQTIIKVHPHMLEIDQIPKVTTDRRQGTVLSITPKPDNNFYSLLRYTPYSDIKENSIRVLDIPRLPKLQFHSIAESEEMEQRAREFSLADDDGVGYLCCSLIRRELCHNRTCFFDSEAQTDVSVVPHVLLDDNNVAFVFTTRGSQTYDHIHK